MPAPSARRAILVQPDSLELEAVNGGFGEYLQDLRDYKDGFQPEHYPESVLSTSVWTGAAGGLGGAGALGWTAMSAVLTNPGAYLAEGLAAGVGGAVLGGFAGVVSGVGVGLAVGYTAYEGAKALQAGGEWVSSLKPEDPEGLQESLDGLSMNSGA
jgi:hypothetical protein